MTAMAANASFATFDSVVTGTDLSAYQEDGMWITVNKQAFQEFDPSHGHGGGFSGGFHYPSGGANGATSISMVNGSVMGSISMTLGDGFGGPDTYYHYWAYLGGNLVNDGWGTHTSGDMFNYVGSFDMFRIGAISDGQQQNLGPDDFQAVAIDNVRTDVVPEPASMTVLALGLAAVARRRRSK